MAIAKYRRGRIVWAWLRSGAGKKEVHPAVIISSNAEIIQPEQFDPRRDFSAVNAVAVLGISTEYKKYPPFVVLPFDKSARGHVVTGLTHDCGACIGWYDWVVLEDDVVGRGGDAPAAEMQLIMQMVANDLKTKMARHVAELQGKIGNLHEALSELLGNP